MKNKELRERLHEPEKAYRSAPFWAFNGKFQEENLRFQIREMKNAGMGGFFIHSREGLETPYLSPEWMEAVAQSIDEAKKQDMEVWIYDEDKWPSGAAGGLVSAAEPEGFSAKGLTLEALLPEQAKELQEASGEKLLAVFTAEIKNGKLLSLSRGIEDGKRQAANPEGQVKILVFRQEISGTSEWYNGYAPPDNLNPQAVRRFLELTHEKYKERFGMEFGGQIQGFFTDEPNCCDFFSVFTKGRPWLTWTDEFPGYFFQKRGYDLIEWLPYLFYEGEAAPGIRHDFWRTVTERFQESYMKQMYDWCEANHVELTGHMLYENDLGYQTRVCGSAMAQYKYLHRPGIDLLGEQTKEYLTVKQCTSAARQYGRKHTITETYGCTGWEFGFEGQKWLGDWQFVMGIDRRCQHLAQYSIAGCRKRDYPPVFSYQTTWWKYNKLLEDYFSRISLCMEQGEVLRDVLVLHPMSSVWAACGSCEEENLEHMEMNMGWLDEHIVSLNRLGEEYNRLAKMLLGSHVDFDFGDELLLEQDGAAEEGGVLRMGLCTYHTVIVPRITSMFESTLLLLKEFAGKGGRLIFTTPLPAMLEGKKNPGLEKELRALPGAAFVSSYEELLRYLNQELPDPLHIRNRDGQEDSGILSSIRKTEDGYLLFLVNNDRENVHQVSVRLPFHGRLTAYDPWNDRDSEVRMTGNGFVASFAPAESRIYFLKSGDERASGEEAAEETLSFPYEHPHYAAPVFAALGPAASVRRTIENVLTLDVCRYALKGEGLSEAMPVWEAQREIRNRLSMQQVYYNGAPQRYFWLSEGSANDGTPFTLDFAFAVAEAPGSDCFAVIEKPEGYTVRLNGSLCRPVPGYFMDRDMKRFLLPEMKPGVQRLEITGPYQQKTELEDIYITGDFAVDTRRRIGRESGQLHFGDWCFQGYYHYPGSMVYEFPLPGKEAGGHRYFLKLGEFRAALAAVRLNGRDVGYAMGRTIRELELTEAMEEKENFLEIEVVGSPRNMFGPFHQTYTGCSRISWADFRTEGRFYTPDYVLEPYGLLGQIAITMI